MNQQINIFCHLINELRYRINNNIPLDSKYEKIRESLIILIPMFNKLMGNETITLENIAKLTDTNAHTRLIDLNTNVIDVESNDETTDTSVSDDMIDANGDISVNELNKLSFELLQKYKLNNWILYTLKNNINDTIATDRN